MGTNTVRNTGKAGKPGEGVKELREKSEGDQRCLEHLRREGKMKEIVEESCVTINKTKKDIERLADRVDELEISSSNG